MCTTDSFFFSFSFSFSWYIFFLYLNMYTPIACQCSLDLNGKIKIIEAEKKQTEGNKNTFVVYTIKRAEVRKRLCVWEKPR